MTDVTSLETICERMGLDIKRAIRVLRSSGVPIRGGGSSHFISEKDMFRARLILSKAKSYAGGNSLALEQVEYRPIKHVVCDIVFRRGDAEYKGVVCGGLERRKIAMVRWRDSNGYSMTTDVHFNDIIAEEQQVLDMILYAKRRIVG
jgi:hypothetical protein